MWKLFLVALVAMPAAAQVSIDEATQRLYAKDAARKGYSMPATTQPNASLVEVREAEIAALKETLRAKEAEIEILRKRVDDAQKLIILNYQLKADNDQLRQRLNIATTPPSPKGAKERFSVAGARPDDEYSMGFGLKVGNLTFKSTGNQMSVVGEITNNRDHACGFTNPKINLYDADGKLLGVASAILDSVPAGTSLSFEAISSPLSSNDVSSFSVQIQKPQ